MRVMYSEAWFEWNPIRWARPQMRLRRGIQTGQTADVVYVRWDDAVSVSWYPAAFIRRVIPEIW